MHRTRDQDSLISYITTWMDGNLGKLKESPMKMAAPGGTSRSFKCNGSVVHIGITSILPHACMTRRNNNLCTFNRLPKNTKNSFPRLSHYPRFGQTLEEVPCVRTSKIAPITNNRNIKYKEFARLIAPNTREYRKIQRWPDESLLGRVEARIPRT